MMKVSRESNGKLSAVEIYELWLGLGFFVNGRTVELRIPENSWRALKLTWWENIHTFWKGLTSTLSWTFHNIKRLDLFFMIRIPNISPSMDDSPSPGRSLTLENLEEESESPLPWVSWWCQSMTLMNSWGMIQVDSSHVTALPKWLNTSALMTFSREVFGFLVSWMWKVTYIEMTRYISLKNCHADPMN